MSDLGQQVDEFKKKLDKSLDTIEFSKKLSDLSALELKAKNPDFWSDSASAQVITKKIARTSSAIKPWQELVDEFSEINQLISLNDPSLTGDISKQLGKLERSYNKLVGQSKFTGLYEDHDVIISIHAGAGGVDAQDWAAMLERMYLRWASNHKYSTKVLNESAGDEAGIKSATIDIEGDNIYGQLKHEHGVHRLVRLSPYNSANLRQTSFAKVEVMPKIDSPSEVDIDDKDLKVDVYRSGGKGGQSVNTTDSAVRITHIPSGVSVSIQNERSQLQNKETALTLIRSKLAQLSLEQHKEKLGDIKGPNQSAEWGNQIRSYVLHPYKQVKDIRTKYESKDPLKVLDGDIDGFISAGLA